MAWPGENGCCPVRPRWLRTFYGQLRGQQLVSRAAKVEPAMLLPAPLSPGSFLVRSTVRERHMVIWLPPMCLALLENASRRPNVFFICPHLRIAIRYWWVRL